MAQNEQEWASAIRGAGSAYGINPRFLQAINGHEQSGTSDFVINDWDSNAAKGTPSGGPFQFIKPTFDAFARQAREANPAAWQGVKFDWRNPQAQALAASWAFANGKGSHWATYDKALKAVGGQMKGATGVASAVRSGAATGGSRGTPGGDGRKAAALNLIFDGDPLFAMAAREDAPAPDAAPAIGSEPTGFQRAEGKGFFARRKGETGQQYLDRLLQKKFGLKHDAGNSQTTGGRHTEGSLHYSGLATDYGDAKNDRGTLNAAVNWIDQNRGNFVGGIAELYGPGDAGHPHSMHAATVRSIRGGKKRTS